MITKVRVTNIISRFNLERNDIKQLHDGDLITCRIGDHREAATIISELWKEVEKYKAAEKDIWAGQEHQ